MKRKWFFRKLFLGMACFSAMLFFGCGRDGAEVSPSAPPAAAPSPTAAPTAPATETPAASTASPAPVLAPALSPSPTPFAINAVYGFYGQFQAECGALLDGYAAGLSDLNSADGLSYSLLLSEHRAYLSECRITVGRLQGSDGDGYSGTLEAAAPGSGRMRGSGENGYTFSYAYNDGRTLTGSFAENTLEFTLLSPEGSATLFCRMQKAGDVWTSSAAIRKYQSELTVCLSPGETEEPIRFGVRSGNYLPATESTAEQEGE